MTLNDILSMFNSGSNPPGLHTEDQMIRNLLGIERATGNPKFLDALNRQLVEQGRGIELTQSKKGIQRLFPTQLGETTGILGLPPGLGGLKRTGIYSDVHTPTDAIRNTLKGRNPYVQSLLDTLAHELGHVADQITPRAKMKSPESVAGAFGGEGRPSNPDEAKRLKEIEDYLGIFLQEK